MVEKEWNTKRETPTLQWSEIESAKEIRTGIELDQLLDQITAVVRPEFPVSVRLRAHDCEVDILLGLDSSFVYLNETKRRRYFVTIGDLYFDGVVSFSLLSQHHTEFERRHLIPMADARRVLREFFEAGKRSTSVEWEEGSY